MTDYVWPDDLVPFASTFYLRPHTSRSISPFTRQQKIYENSAPLWMCNMSFRGGYDGTREQEAYGPRLDAFLTKLRGGVNRVAIYDFRRSKLRGSNTGWSLSNDAASLGDTALTINGFMPNSRAFFPGDYVGGDGRPHIVTNDDVVFADDDGIAEIDVWPPLVAAIAGGDAIYGAVPGWFRLASDDAGANPTVVGEAVQIDLELIEDVT